MDSQWEFAIWHRKLKSSVKSSDNLNGWDGMEGRFKKEETYEYLWLIHVDVWQKAAQYCNYPPIKKK